MLKQRQQHIHVNWLCHSINLKPKHNHADVYRIQSDNITGKIKKLKKVTLNTDGLQQYQKHLQLSTEHKSNKKALEYNKAIIMMMTKNVWNVDKMMKWW